MALKKPNPSASPAKTTPEFEQEPGSGGETAVLEKELPEEHPSTDAGAAASTAIAKAASTSVGTVNEAALAAKQFRKEVEAMEGDADFTYGSHRVFKAMDGEIKETNGDEVNLGKWVKVRLLAWGRHFEISPGDESASSGGFVAYSDDGVTVKNVVGDEMKSWEGKPVQEYLEYLRTTEEFEEASLREFIDCQAAALGSESEPTFMGVIQVTLSSSSIPAFRKYQNDLEATAKCVGMGLPGYSLPEDPFTFYFIREAASKGNHKWTKLRISATLPVKV